MKSFILLIGVCIGLVGCELDSGSDEDLFHVYLTWQSEDTSTTMTVNFHATKKEFKSPIIYYDTESRGGDPAQYQFQQTGKSVRGFGQDRVYHRIELKNLAAGATYYFIAGGPHAGFSEEKKFKTISMDDDKPLRFVSGGDMGTGEEVAILNEVAATYRPDFAMIGGDIAYANGKLGNLYLWDEWLKAWQEKMITPEGYMVPVVAAIGNHEVSHLPLPFFSPFFFKVFAQEKRVGRMSYFKRKFGDRLVLYVLDTGHKTNYSGRQLRWLKRAMKANQNVPYNMALYHIPLYPGHRSHKLSAAKKGRKYWGPVFDRYRLDVAFENHDHVHKRTKRLRNNKVHPQGTLYLGDGAWGRNPREEKKRWYLERGHSIGRRHFWYGELDSEQAKFQAVDEAGEVFDEVTVNP